MEIKDIIVKLLSHLSKRALSIIVIALFGLLINMWFKYSEYSPKAIVEGQNDLKNFVMYQSQISNRNDSIQDSKLDELYKIQFIQGTKLDTMINYQTPELIKKINLMNVYSVLNTNKLNRNIGIPKLDEIKVSPTPIVDTKYEETLTLLDDIDKNASRDTIKKKNIETDL